MCDPLDLRHKAHLTTSMKKTICAGTYRSAYRFQQICVG